LGRRQNNHHAADHEDHSTARVPTRHPQPPNGVDAAILVVAAGATFAAGLPFWPHARRTLRG
jgi:hypothetical protein